MAESIADLDGWLLQIEHPQDLVELSDLASASHRDQCLALQPPLDKAP